MEREILETRGDFRAVIIRDDGADKPDYDGQAVVLSYDYRHDWNVSCENDVRSGDRLAYALKHFMDAYNSRRGMPLFQRYARIFHGTRDIRTFRYSYVPDSVEYMALDTEALRTEWGYDGDDGAKGDAETWQAYIDGDVYGIGLEHRRAYTQTTEYADGETVTRTGEDWEETKDGFVWGYYGREYAEAEALSMLNDAAPNA